MTGKAMICPECGAEIARRSPFIVAACFSGRRIHVCSAKCEYFHGYKVDKEERYAPRWAAARARVFEQEVARSERRAEIDAGIG